LTYFGKKGKKKEEILSVRRIEASRTEKNSKKGSQGIRPFAKGNVPRRAISWKKEKGTKKTCSLLATEKTAQNRRSEEGNYSLGDDEEKEDD